MSLTLNWQVAETVYGDENVTMNKQLPDIIMANEEEQNGHDVSKVLYFMERVVLLSIFGDNLLMEAISIIHMPYAASY